jgi:ribosomal protein S18 acetylase RimI-like enzyme
VADIAAAERFHYELQLGCYFTTIYDASAAKYAYSDLVDDFIWNHALSTSTPDNRCAEFIDSAITFFRTRRRRPCVYVSDRTRPAFLPERLKDAGFGHVDTELWMFHVGQHSPIPTLGDVAIVAVNTPERLGQFLIVLGQCFRCDYAAAVQREFEQYQAHKVVEHVLATIDGEVTGIGSLYSSGDHSVIHNLATLQACRRQGVGTALLDHLARKATSRPTGRVLYLQCEAGMEHFYARRGFRTEFRRYGYVLGEAHAGALDKSTLKNCNAT